MKNLYARAIFVFLMLSAFFTPQIIQATVEDARNLAEEMILVYKNHLNKLEDINFINQPIPEYQFHIGYVNGAKDAYTNMIKMIEKR
jgi:hypothetical protein